MRVSSQVVPWIGLGLAIVSACAPGQEAARERSASVRQAVTDVSDGPEAPPDFQVYQGYVVPDTSVDRTQGLADLAALRVTLGKPYVGQGFGPQPPGGGGGGVTCDTSNCAAPDKCISNECSAACLVDTSPCPFGTTQGTDSMGACFCIPNTPGSGPTAGACGWSHVGPTNVPGRVLDLAIDSTGTTMFAATVGGIWKSTDPAHPARRWQRVSDDFLGGKAESIAINPTNSAEVIAGLGDDQNEHGFVASRPIHVVPLFPGNGIWMSSTNGNPGTWTQVSPPALNDSVVSDLLYAPDGNTVYAATSVGVFIGTRSGGTLSFQRLGNLSYPTDTIVGDFTGTTPLLYAGVRESGTNSGVWKYDGTSWAQKNSGIPADSFSRVTLAITPTNTKVLYAKIASSSLAFTGFFKTINSAEPPASGTAWVNLPIPPVDASGFHGPNDCTAPLSTGSIDYQNYNSVIAVDPNDETVLFSGGRDLWRSADSGSTWTDVSSSTDGVFTTGVHADQHAIVFDPAHKGVVYAGCDGGIYRSTDTRISSRHWTQVAHGMATTEFYDIAGQANTASLTAGGAQDNGTNITFGNRTWYNDIGGDGSNVSVDALNNMTVYANANGVAEGLIQPIAYDALGQHFIQATTTGAFGWQVPTGLTMVGPIVADPTVGGVALGAAGTGAVTLGTTIVADTILRTTDGIHWTSVLPAASGSSLPASPWDSRHPIAISTSTNGNGKKTCYAAIQSGPGTTTNTVWVSEDSGVTWTAGGALAGGGSVNAITVDPTNSEHAVASTGGATGENIFLSSDGGKSWTQVTDAGGVALPTGAVRNVAFDPSHSSTLYVAHQVGVFEGTLSGTSATWTTFDEGLPNGVDVHDIVTNPSTKTLTIGTFGFGAYRRDLSATGTCPATQLLVRDNVFDQGQSPSPSGIPDPEHPVDDGNTGFFHADSSNGGKVYFWDSTDIRIDVPSQQMGTDHEIAQADHVEFETCPVERGDRLESCPSGVMVDTNPVRNDSVNAYVQVTNLGLQPAQNVRVITLFTDATVQVPNLPSDFWTTTLPDLSTLQPGDPVCGQLNTASPWKLVGCGTMSSPVNPDYPEVQQFQWQVPPTAADHSCMVTIVESKDDPATNIRGKFATESLVQADRHIAQRNLHIVSLAKGQSLTVPFGGFSGMTSVLVPNYTTNQQTRTVLLSRSGMGNGRLSFLLPVGVAKNTSGLPNAGCGGSGRVPAGAKVLTIALPKGVSEQMAAVEANGSLLIGNGAVIRGQSGGFAGAANAGCVATNVGDNARVGNLFSASSVNLEQGSTVNGVVETSASTITQQSGVTVTGGVQTGVAFTPGDQLSWQVQVPSGLGTNINVLPLQTLKVAPGNYGLVSVPLGGTLSLTSGAYFVDTLNISAGATVSADTSAGPTVIYVRSSWVDWGTVTETPGGGANLLVVYLAGVPTGIAGPFSGTFVAPNTLLTVGPTGTGVAQGSFFAQNLAVYTGTTVVSRPFAGWNGLGACEALSASETSAATQLGLDPSTVYPVSGVETQIVLPVGPGGQLTLGLRYESGTGSVDSATAARFRVLSLEGATVLGGSTFVVRRP